MKGAARRQLQRSTSAGTGLSDLLGGIADFDSAFQKGLFCGPPAAGDTADGAPEMADALVDALCDEDDELFDGPRIVGHPLWPSLVDLYYSCRQARAPLNHLFS